MLTFVPRYLACPLSLRDSEDAVARYTELNEIIQRIHWNSVRAGVGLHVRYGTWVTHSLIVHARTCPHVAVATTLSRHSDRHARTSHLQTTDHLQQLCIALYIVSASRVGEVRIDRSRPKVVKQHAQSENYLARHMHCRRSITNPDPAPQNTLLPQIMHFASHRGLEFPRCIPIFPVIGKHINHRHHSPALGIHDLALLIRVLVVDALGSLAWVRGKVNCAWIPFGVMRELALEVESVVDIRKSEIDVVALEYMSASSIIPRRGAWIYSLLVQSCPA